MLWLATNLLVTARVSIVLRCIFNLLIAFKMVKRIKLSVELACRVIRTTFFNVLHGPSQCMNRDQRDVTVISGH